MKFKQILFVILLILLIILMVQNSHMTKVEFLFWHLDIPTILLLLITAIVGMIIGWFAKMYLGKRKAPSQKISTD